MRQMIRVLVGTMLEVGGGRRSVASFVSLVVRAAAVGGGADRAGARAVPRRRGVRWRARSVFVICAPRGGSCHGFVATQQLIAAFRATGSAWRILGGYGCRPGCKTQQSPPRRRRPGNISATPALMLPRSFRLASFGDLCTRAGWGGRGAVGRGPAARVDHDPSAARRRRRAGARCGGAWNTGRCIAGIEVSTSSATRSPSQVRTNSAPSSPAGIALSSATARRPRYGGSQGPRSTTSTSPWSPAVAGLATGYASTEWNELSDTDRAHKSGIPVTSPARAIVDYAATANSGELEYAIAEACAKRLTDEPRILAAIERVPNYAGVGSVRAILGQPGGASRTRSGGERAMLRLIRAAGLPAPRTNLLIAGFTADFVWEDQRLIVEVDGHPYHSSRRAFERDHRRDIVHKNAGYEVLRFTARQLAEEPLLHVAGWGGGRCGGAWNARHCIADIEACTSSATRSRFPAPASSLPFLPAGIALSSATVLRPRSGGSRAPRSIDVEITVVARGCRSRDGLRVHGWSASTAVIATTSPASPSPRRRGPSSTTPPPPAPSELE